jgi:cytochrome c-type biogenesis protein CcmE
MAQAQANWEKTTINAGTAVPLFSARRLKFLIGGGLILVAVAYLVISGTLAGASYFITVDQLLKNPDYIGKSVRISGAVLGDSIQYDSKNLLITFTIANVPTDYQDLGEALHNAVGDPNAKRLQVRVENQVKPDLLQHEAQAILAGKLDKNGVFQATELLLKCPTRFQEAKPDQQQTQSSTAPKA